jgi:hypothetical protein
LNTIQAEASAVAIGWRPVARSMMARRVMPRPIPGSMWVPSSSGPRCLSTRTMAASSSGGAPPAYPAMPHMALGGVAATGAEREKDREIDGPHAR